MREIPVTDIPAIIKLLVAERIEFILIGGVAASIHGSARLTIDVDVVYRRSQENILRIAKALRDRNAYLRGAPPNLPFSWDVPTITAGLNFTLITDLGAVDFLGEIVGGGNYDQLIHYAEEKEAFGVRCNCLKLEKLIQVKQAAGRPKDFEAIAELQLLLHERNTAAD